MLEVNPGGDPHSTPGGAQWAAFDTTWTMENLKKVLVFLGERCRIVELEGGESELLAKVRRLFKLSYEEILSQKVFI